jgi:hypothetical protein
VARSVETDAPGRPIGSRPGCVLLELTGSAHCVRCKPYKRRLGAKRARPCSAQCAELTWHRRRPINSWVDYLGRPSSTVNPIFED